MNYLGVAGAEECSSIGTIVHVAIDGIYAGHMVIADELKPHAKEAIAELKKMGVKRTYMLTGDGAKVADSIAKEAGVDEVHAELLPAQKVEIVEDILKRRTRAIHLLSSATASTTPQSSPARTSA